MTLPFEILKHLTYIPEDLLELNVKLQGPCGKEIKTFTNKSLLTN